MRYQPRRDGAFITVLLSRVARNRRAQDLYLQQGQGTAFDDTAHHGMEGFFATPEGLVWDTSITVGECTWLEDCPSPAPTCGGLSCRFASPLDREGLGVLSTQAMEGSQNRVSQL